MRKTTEPSQEDRLKQNPREADSQDQELSPRSRPAQGVSAPNAADANAPADAPVNAPANAPADAAPQDAPSFEERLRRLQEIVGLLEAGDLPLKESVGLYREGLLLARACREQLDQARHHIQIWSEGSLEDFHENPESSANERD